MCSSSGAGMGNALSSPPPPQDSAPAPLGANRQRPPALLIPSRQEPALGSPCRQLSLGMARACCLGGEGPFP